MAVRLPVLPPLSPEGRGGNNLEVTADLEDLVAHGPARDGDLGDVADLLAHQAPAARAGRQDPAVLVVLVAGADQDEVLDLAGVEVLDADLGAEDDSVLGQLGHVDDDGPGQAVLLPVDAGLQVALVLAGGVVLGVLAEVALVAGLGDTSSDLDHVAVQASQVALELVVLLLGHGHAFGRHVYSRTTDS